MLLVCPSCTSAFRIPPAAITAAGRTVRCSHCQHVWTAVPADLVPEPDLETAEAAGRVAGRNTLPTAAASATDASDDESRATEGWAAEGWGNEPEVDPRFQIDGDDIIAVDRPLDAEEAMIDAADAPPLVPQDALPAGDAFGDEPRSPTGDGPDADDADGVDEARSQAGRALETASLDAIRLDGRPSDGGSNDGEETAPRLRRPSAPAKPGVLSRLLGVAATALLVAVAVLFIWRSDLVRLAPSLAGFYRLFGIEVNLRGLQLHEVRAMRTAVDGVPVLSIEGFVFNPGPKAAEVPKLRMAILGAGGRELYVWTAEPPQPMLKAGESFALRSRLAAPPQDGQEVVVRFLRKRDLANYKP
jgi:predicted Zn finger-like uncharacterized protein